MRPGAGRLLAIAALLVAATASCGIPGEDSARTITAPQLPSHADTTGTAIVGAVDEELMMVKDGQLVLVRRRVQTAPTLEQLAADLLAGPTDTERRGGYTSALLGTDMIAAIGRDGSQAVVDLGPDGADQVRNDQVLGIGQIVCTLTRLPDVTAVRFRSGGQAVAVPRADGSLADGPLTAADYQGLTTSVP